MTRRGSEHGVTVLEVVVAVVLFAVIIAATAGILSLGSTRGAQNRRATEAAILAQRELERLRHTPYDQLPESERWTETVGTNMYTLEREMLRDQPEANMTWIRITVSWDSVGPQTYVVETIFTDLEG
jgi:type II secretory pathway pseudopilin PulG